MKNVSIIISLFCLGAALFIGSNRLAAQAPPPLEAPYTNPLVRIAESSDLSPRLDSLPPAAVPAQAGTLLDVPRLSLPSTSGGSFPTPSVLQTAPVPDASDLIPLPTTLLSFDGIPATGFVPPDPNGDIGPNHYVQIVNAAFAVYSRTGATLLAPRNISSLWSGFGGACESYNRGDPIALYDPLADRWLISQFAWPSQTTGPYYQCVAISTSPDPTGTYYRYAYKISDTLLNDYPKFGVWPDGYYLTVNLFEGGTSYAGQGVGVFERQEMLTGDPAARLQFFILSSNSGGMLPSDLDGPLPPSNAPNYYVQFLDDYFNNQDQLRLWEFKTNWNDPTKTTFSQAATLYVTPFDSNMCGGARNCIPQKGTTIKVDAIASLMMYRLQYRNFGGYQSLVTNHTVDVNGTDLAGLRWYELRKLPGSGWKVYQQGTHSLNDGQHRWMGSAAQNQYGQLALGYSISSTTLYPSIRYVGRLAGDPLGVITLGEGSLVEGTGAQTRASGRWGDYSMLAVDPLDDCTFWFTHQYYTTISDGSWHTRIGSFRLGDCSAIPPTETPTPTKTSTPTATPTHTPTPTPTPTPQPKLFLPFVLQDSH